MVDGKNQVSEEQVSEDDLDKIMQEIVADEEVAQAEVAAESEAPSVAAKAASEGNSSVPASAGATVSPIRVVPSPVSVAPAKNGQALRLEFSGPINLKLEFNAGGKSIELNCTDDGLFCRMADGTEFKIPTGNASPGLKKVG